MYFTLSLPIALSLSLWVGVVMSLHIHQSFWAQTGENRRWTMENECNILLEWNVKYYIEKLDEISLFRLHCTVLHSSKCVFWRVFICILWIDDSRNKLRTRMMSYANVVHEFTTEITHRRNRRRKKYKYTQQMKIANVNEILNGGERDEERTLYIGDIIVERDKR